MRGAVGLIGIGAIGLPVAVNLMAAGYAVHGYRRSAMDDFIAAGGRPAACPRDVALACDTVISCVNTAQAAEELLAGPEGVLAAGREDLVVIEMNTINLPCKEGFKAAVDAAGGTLLDSPILGVPGAVAARKAVIFVSGDRGAYERVRGVYDAITERASYVGPFGNGLKMKYVANTLVGVHIAVAGEAMALARKAGVPHETVMEMLAGTASSSFQFDARAPMMAKGAWRPALASHTVLEKDLSIIEEFADSIGCVLPLLATASAYYRRSMAEGRGQEDCASIYDVILRDCGIDQERS